MNGAPGEGGGDPTLQALSAALGHPFDTPSLLADAVTHPSVGGTERGRHDRSAGLAYERLEFLGDRVLGLVIAAWLLERFPDEREGDLAKRHAGLVRRESLCRVANAIDLGVFLRLSPGEAASGGRHNQTILSDACEAVIGALYLDGGLPAADQFIRSNWEPLIHQSTAPPKDSKTTLQELVQGRGMPLPSYRLVNQTGPAHEPVFEVSVHVPGQAPTSGVGRNRRGAEMAAAAAMLQQLQETPFDPGRA